MKEQKMSTQVFIKRIVRLRRHVTQYFVHWSKNDKAASYIFPKDAKLINRSLYNGGWNNNFRRFAQDCNILTWRLEQNTMARKQEVGNRAIATPEIQHV